MPGLDPGIQTLVLGVWMAGSSPAMTGSVPLNKLDYSLINRSGAAVSETKVLDHVALISEWDTIYGRTIVPTMIRAFAKKNENTDLNCTTREEPGNYHPNQCPWAHEIKYLRGLDGALPRSDEIEDKEGNKQAKGESDVPDDVRIAIKDRAKAKADEQAFDHPHGQGQQDYLHRLAKSLLEEDKRLRRPGDGSGIKAIGVLSDVFDKLLVFRALKPLFPQALFFTTDFDYTLTMQSELGWTPAISSSLRALVRRLDPKTQSQIPPFRGSYETSAFLATQLAIGSSGQDDPCLLKVDPSSLVKPRIFEIKRTGDVLPFPSLKEEDESGKRECVEKLKQLNGLTTIHPIDEPIYPKPRGLDWLAGLLGIPVTVSLAYLLGQARAGTQENNNTCNQSKQKDTFFRIVLGFIVKNIEAISLSVVLLGAACLILVWDSKDVLLLVV